MIIGAVIAGIVVAIILSACFSGSEMAFSSCNQIRLEREAEKGSKKAKRALTLAERFDDTLSTILIGNNLVNIGASSLTTVLVILLFGSDKLNWLGTLIVTILVIIFGETIPKIYCKENANKIALIAAGPLTALKIILKPITLLVVGLVNLITKPIKEDKNRNQDEETTAELQSIIETAEGEGVLDSNRSEMVAAAIDFSDTSADEVMTSRVDVLAIDIDDDRQEIIDAALSSTHSRIPVYEDTIDHIIGVVHLNHLLKAFAEDDNADLRSILMEPCFVYKTTKLPQVLDTLKKNRQHLAIVTDEYSATLGVISMEDVLEEIVGDIWDETDVVKVDFRKYGEGNFRVNGDMTIFDFLELIDVPEEEYDYDSSTVGGLVIELNGDFPKRNDSVEFMGYNLKVIGMDERRVTRVWATKLPETEKDK